MQILFFIISEINLVFKRTYVKCQTLSKNLVFTFLQRDKTPCGGEGRHGRGVHCTGRTVSPGLTRTYRLCVGDPTVGELNLQGFRETSREEPVNLLSLLCGRLQPSPAPDPGSAPTRRSHLTPGPQQEPAHPRSWRLIGQAEAVLLPHRPRACPVPAAHTARPEPPVKRSHSGGVKSQGCPSTRSRGGRRTSASQSSVCRAAQPNSGETECSENQIFFLIQFSGCHRIKWRIKCFKSF